MDSLHNVLIETSKENLDDEQRVFLSQLLVDLIVIAEQAFAGDAFANKQLEAVSKLVRSAEYRTLPKLIDKIVTTQYKLPASHERARNIIDLMIDLWIVVEPVRYSGEERYNVAVRPVLKRACDTDLYALATKYCRKGTTLQSLAIKVYLEQLRDEGHEGVDERALKRDLQKYREWVKSHPEARGNILPEQLIPQPHSTRSNKLD